MSWFELNKYNNMHGAKVKIAFSIFLNNLLNDCMSFVQAIYPAVVGLMNVKNVK